MSKRPVLLVGISGCSSSGKTTLARLLRDIWPNSFILHQDDFYWPDDQIPVASGIRDWDCMEAFDLERLRKSLAHIKTRGTPPPDLKSKEDKNSVGECNVDQDAVEYWRQIATSSHQNSSPYIAFVDGILLYPHSMCEIRNLFDLKLFLRTDYATVKARRESRKGYVTVDGFWEDPPGYVDKIVWPNYVREHAFLFRNENVEGEPNDEASQWLGIEVVPRFAQNDMTASLNWACEILRKNIFYA